MKKKLSIALIIITLMICLSGCGTSFTLTQDDLQSYSEENDGYFRDITDEYASNPKVKSVYQVYIGSNIIQLWEFADTEDASEWANQNANAFKEDASVFKGSSFDTNADFFVKKKYGTSYRLLQCETTGVFVSGSNSDNIETILKGLDVIEK